MAGLIFSFCRPASLRKTMYAGFQNESAMWQVSFFILPTDILIEKQCMPVFKTRVPRGSSHFFILPTGISKENNVCRFSKREPEAGLRKASSRPKFCAKLISEATPPRPTSAERRNTVRAHRSLAASLPVCCRLRHACMLPSASALPLPASPPRAPEPRQPARCQVDRPHPTHTQISKPTHATIRLQPCPVMQARERPVHGGRG